VTPTLLVQADRAAVYYRAARKGHKRSQERYLIAKQLRHRCLMKDVRESGGHIPRHTERVIRHGHS
jgi:hypothetical protein